MASDISSPYFISMYVLRSTYDMTCDMFYSYCLLFVRVAMNIKDQSSPTTVLVTTSSIGEDLLICKPQLGTLTGDDAIPYKTADMMFQRKLIVTALKIPPILVKRP